MRKSAKLLCSGAIAMMVLSVHPAVAEGGGAAIYVRTYYSDATHQTQVGSRIFRECQVGPMGDEVVYDKLGSQTVYYTQEFDGWCMDGEHILP